MSIDAIGCQKAVAEQLVKAKADYVLALKDNHPTLRADVALWLDSEIELGRLAVQETLDKGHGRIEVRRYALSTQLDWLSARHEWAGLAAIGRVESIRHLDGKQSRECRYFLSSVTVPEVFARVVHDHWAIENAQHWLLDVQFDEDGNRTRKNHAASNLALIRRASLNLLRDNDASALSIRRRRSPLRTFSLIRRCMVLIEYRYMPSCSRL